MRVGGILISNEELVKAYKNGHKGALEELINNNQGLIYKMIKRYNFIYEDYRIADKEDLIQEAYIGIIEAAKDFNIEEGVRFMTYAPWHIKKRLYAILGRSNKEQKNRKLNMEAKRLDAPIINKEGGETTAIDLIKDDSSMLDFEIVEERLYHKALKHDLRVAFEENIVGRGKDIICYRYKLKEKTNGDVRSYKEASNIFKLSVTRIRQMESNALVKIRKTKWYRDSKYNYDIGLTDKVEDYSKLYEIKSFINTYDVIDKVNDEQHKHKDKVDFKNHIINKYLKGF